jgi:hypothetical protein
MNTAITKNDKQISIGEDSIWMVNFLHESLIRSILNNLLNFKASNKELLSSLFQLNLVLGSLPKESLNVELFKEILKTLSKTMITYKDDDEIIKKIIQISESLSNPVAFEAGLQIFLFIAKNNHNQGAIASLEAISFLLYIFIRSNKSLDPMKSLKGVEIITSSILPIKDGLISNVNVSMFIHDSLLHLTSNQSPSSLSEEFSTESITLFHNLIIRS